MTGESIVQSLAELEATMPPTLPALLRHSADAMSDREAFVFFDHGITLTYAELDVQVRSVAAGLSEMGVRKGTHVAMMLPNCVEFPVTWLAIAWMGAVSIQVNPLFTATELDYVLNDADVDFIVLDESCLPAFEAMAQRSERLPNDNVLVRAEAPLPDTSIYRPWSDLTTSEPLSPQPLQTVSANDLMSLLYTSGTTGFPKGCMLDHRYWVQIATVALHSQGDHTPRNSLIYEPMFYIQGNALFLASLLANATVYCSARASIANFLPWVQVRDRLLRVPSSCFAVDARVPRRDGPEPCVRVRLVFPRRCAEPGRGPVRARGS